MLIALFSLMCYIEIELSYSNQFYLLKRTVGAKYILFS